MRKITPELIAEARANAARRALTEQVQQGKGTVSQFMNVLREEMAEARKAS